MTEDAAIGPPVRPWRERLFGGRLVLSLRWPLLVIYIVLLLSLSGWIIGQDALGGGLTVGIGLLCQILFFVARGDRTALGRARRRQLVAPVLVGGFAFALLLGGLILAIGELAELTLDDPLLFLSLAATWILWTLVFLVLGIQHDYLRNLRRIVLTLLAGSLLQLIATVTSHVLVLRRGGCFAGIGTAFGVAAGVAVAVWAFGPAVILLFWYERRRRLVGHCRRCGYSLRGLTEPRCPECGQAFPPSHAGRVPPATEAAAAQR